MPHRASFSCVEIRPSWFRSISGQWWRRKASRRAVSLGSKSLGLVRVVQAIEMKWHDDNDFIFKLRQTFKMFFWLGSLWAFFHGLPSSTFKSNPWKTIVTGNDVWSKRIHIVKLSFPLPVVFSPQKYTQAHRFEQSRPGIFVTLLFGFLPLHEPPGSRKEGRHPRLVGNLSGCC